MDKRAKYRKHTEDLKKLAQSQAEFKQKVQQARSGQIKAEEERTKMFKPVAEALLGKQSEISPLLEDLKILQEKGFLGLDIRHQEITGDRIIAKTEEDKKKKKIAMALTAHIVDPANREDRYNFYIDNPLALERRLSDLSILKQIDF